MHRKNGFDGFVDGDPLVIARFLAADVFEIIPEEDFFLFRGLKSCDIYQDR